MKLPRAVHWELGYEEVDVTSNDPSWRPPRRRNTISITFDDGTQVSGVFRMEKVARNTYVMKNKLLTIKFKTYDR